MRILSLVISGYAVIISSGGSGLMMYAQDPDKSKNKNMAELCDDIGSNEYQKRMSANIELQTIKIHLGDKLVEVFKKSAGNEYEGSKHLAVYQIGYWRLEESIGFLLENVGWELGKGGHEKPEHAYYPCIVALERIGGRRVEVALEQRICKTRDEKALKLLCWTYARVAGREAAANQIKKSIEGIEDEEQKQACRKGVTYIENYESILRTLR